ncbi:hypothetical protein CARUB_v10006050mg [Capsella rubella]|uniref:BHLH domain-containing protein n=2 Tax=Capsella rubella TaxID=81985 RepID=R0F7V2_9BRAS|nr:hypothetical protein CARUB_v10006050mg [Capsella rubella]
MRILKSQRSRGGGGRSKKHVNRRPNVTSRSGEMFTEKLQALKSLLPHPPPSKTTTEKSFQDADVKKDSGSVVETEQLFQETADYIVKLRTQVVVLQKLIEIYGSSSSSDHLTEDGFVL